LERLAERTTGWSWDAEDLPLPARALNSRLDTLMNAGAERVSEYVLQKY
jgi:hypothetical protein